MTFNIIGAIAVFGVCLIVKETFSKAAKERVNSVEIIGNRPQLMSDRRPVGGETMLIPNVLGEPVEGSV